MNADNKKDVIKTWSRRSTIFPSAGDYVVSFIVSRFVDGKDWLQKARAARNA